MSQPAYSLVLARDGTAPAPSNAARWVSVAGLAVLLAIALRMGWHTNGDVSWLLEAAERTLDGAIPYRDFLEANPPASIAIYMPAVFLGRLTGIRQEAMTDALVFVGTAFSLALCSGILGRAGLLHPSRAWGLLCLAIVVLLILPVYSFAQREHVAVLTILPSLAALAARAGGQRPRLSELVLAGIGAGIAVCIKPVFGLAFLGPGLYLLRHRSWRVAVAMPEAWIACCVASLYGLAVILFVPDFAGRVLPLLVSIYVPARLPPSDLFLSPVLWIWLGFLYTYWKVRSPTDPVGAVLVLASAGFAASFCIQGKGFNYHGYPAVALAALGCGRAALDGAIDKAGSTGSRLLSLTPAAVAMAGGLLVFAEYYDIDRLAPGLTQAIAAISPRPRVLTIGNDIRFGRAFAREIGGTWVASTSTTWITSFAAAITPKPDEDRRFAAAIRMERDLYAEDIERRRPDAILIDGGAWWRWTRDGATLARALSQYRAAGQYGEITLLRRKAPALPAPGGAVP